MRFLLSAVLPDAALEQLMKSGVLLGLLDDDDGVNEEMLLALATAHAREYGDIDINLGGAIISLTEANIESLGEHIAKAK